jgi:hypothetical protein
MGFRFAPGDALTKPVLTTLKRDFRNTPESRHFRRQSACLKRADSVAKVPKRRAAKFPPKDKQAVIVDRCRFNRATEVISEFVTE